MNNNDNVITINIDDPDIDNNTGYYTNTTYEDTMTVSDDYNIDFSNIDLSGFNYNPGIDVTHGDIAVHNDGDIKLGERSLKEFMDKVESRLNILQPNPDLEEKWQALKELGDKYRELEKELEEKEKMWDLLRNQ